MATNTYVALKQEVLTGSASSITLSSIPQDYTDLVLVANITGSGGGGVAGLRLNGDTSSLYSTTYAYGNGSAAACGREVNQNAMSGGDFAASGSFSVNVYNIQDYTNTSKNKTVLMRHNVASSVAVMSVGLWRSNTAVTSITIFAPLGIGSTFSLYGIKAASVAQGTAKATGGTISYDQYGNVIHTFTSNGTFTPSEALLNVETLVVAGGGAGGTDYSGGGGAGGYIASINNFGANAYTITVGAGGTGGTRANGADGGNGVASSIAGTGLTTISAVGGGGGGSYNGSSNGKTGGSGGGGAGGYGGGTPGNGGAGTSFQGYSGGRGYVPGGYESNRYGGGGGGASAAGSNATSSAFGQGGTGAMNVISGSAVTYATGGKGCESQSFNGAVSGSANTGNGGQGAGENYTGGNGGSGIVIIRYAG